LSFRGPQSLKKVENFYGYSMNLARLADGSAGNEQPAFCMPNGAKHFLKKNGGRARGHVRDEIVTILSPFFSRSKSNFSNFPIPSQIPKK
jgi:hypothetical protein